MATNTENVNIKINVSADDSMRSVKQMRLELRSMMTQMDEAAAAGDKVKFNELKKNIGELRNDIKDLNQEMKFSDPGEFLAGFTQVAKGAVAGFGAVTGAMELFGASTEDVQEVQKKSMVIIQTLQSLEEVRSLLEAKGAIKGLANSAMRVLGLTGEVVATEAVAGANVQATATQWSWNAAMAANPVGVLIVAIAALAAGIYALTQVMGDNDEVVQQSFINYAELEKTMINLNKKGVESKLKMDLQLKRITQEQYDREILKMQQIAERSDLYDKQSLEKRALYNEWKRKIDEAHEDDQKMLTERAIFDLDNLNKAHAAQTKQIKTTQIQDTITLLNKQKETEVKNQEETTKKTKEETDKKVEINEWYIEQIIKNRAILKGLEKEDSKSNLEYINQQLNVQFAASDKRKQDEENRNNFINQLRLNNTNTLVEEYNVKSDIIDEQYAKDLEKYKNDEEAKKEITAAYEKEKFDLKLEYAAKAADEVTKYSQLASDFVSSLTQMEMANIEEAGENEIGGKERVEREKKAIQKKYAALNLAVQIAQITADVARGITSALSLPFPLSLAVGAIYGGIGIAQTGVATAQYNKIMKLRRGGLLSGPSHEQGGIGIGNGYEAEGGEAILNKKSMSIPALRSMASAINVAGGGVPLSNNTSAGITASIDTNVIEEIVSRVTNNIASIPVNVTEYDITKMQRKVAVIETRSTY